MMQRYIKNWLLPAVALILEYSLVAIVWFFTFHFPRRVFALFNMTIEYKMLVLTILQVFLILLLTYFLNKLDIKYDAWNSLNDIHKKYTKLGIGTFLLFQVLMLLHLYIALRGKFTTLVLILVLIFVIAALLISVLTLINKNYQQKKFVENLTLSIDEEKENFQLAREYRHDFKGILTAMDEYLSNEDIAGAQLYLQEILKNSQQYLKSYHYNQVIMIQNTAIRGLVTEFIRRCEEDAITLSLKIDPLSSLPAMSLIDFIRVLSIIMNNALEAVATEPVKEIAASFEHKNGALVIKISNPACKKLDLTTIFKKGHSTKTDHSGLGLWNLKKILGSYHNCFFFLSQENNFFTAKLILND